ncbi:MAG: hypothetical protein ACT4P7_11245 [Gemmatimonadaceae bacterium]
MPQNIARSRVRLILLLSALVASVETCAKSDGERASGEARESTDERATTDERTSVVEAASIVVNGVALSAWTVRQLQQVYPVAIAPGRYWYDPISGAYGREGEAIGGQMIAGLSLGGPLNADASRGTSGVFINGRQITAGEKTYIELLCQTPVAAARYWIMSNGVGGFEGGPPFFNLGQCPGVPQQNSGGRSMSRTFCDANGACTTSGILGSILTTP